ncbi:unnamed protein product [Rotaria sp. Silwood2]|nr:unnamed protein product [Rotaria sp. Silwood2]CAF4365705.1 unnamed protein product [Rotaria sp. Silwood2]
MLILGSCPFFFMALIWYCGSKIVPLLLLGILMIINAWLLARWCDSFHFWYSVDILTVYFLVWQFSYLMFQWCFHKLSWPCLIFYQSSICILTAIESFIFYDLVFRYFPSITLVMIWFACFDDIIACLYIHGRLRNFMKDNSMNYLMPTYPTFPVFSYYTHDIENGIDAIKGYRALGDSDFFIYNLLLLWLLSPLSSTIKQMLLFFGLTVNIQIGLMITDWIRSLWKEYQMPALPLPVIFVSAYVLIIDFIIKNFDIDYINILDCV